MEVRETTLTLDDFEDADEIFLTGNASKITSVTRYKERDMGAGQMGTRGAFSSIGTMRIRVLEAGRFNVSEIMKAVEILRPGPPNV